MKKLIIFDCDGVLVDSEIIAHRTDIDMLAKLGYTITLEESLRKFTGINGQKAAELIFGESGIRIPDDFFSVVCADKVMAAFETQLQPLMMTVLSNNILKDKDRCVASSSSRARVLRSLEITKQRDYFKDHHVFTSSQVQNGKPAPDLFLFAASHMGYHPKDCLVIEDSIAGIQAAKAANMSVIGFLGGEHASFDWYRAHIEAENIPTVHSTNELLALLHDII